VVHKEKGDERKKVCPSALGGEIKGPEKSIKGGGEHSGKTRKCTEKRSGSCAGPWRVERKKEGGFFSMHLGSSTPKATRGNSSNVKGGTGNEQAEKDSGGVKTHLPSERGKKNVGFTKDEGRDEKKNQCPQEKRTLEKTDQKISSVHAPGKKETRVNENERAPGDGVWLLDKKVEGKILSIKTEKVSVQIMGRGEGRAD